MDKLVNSAVECVELVMHNILLQGDTPFKPDYAAVREDIAKLLDDDDYDDGRLAYVEVA